MTDQALPPDDMGTRTLLAAYLAGDREAERKLFAEHWDWLLAQARNHRLMPVLRRHVGAESLVSDAFVKVLGSTVLSSLTLERKDDLRAYLRKVLSSVMIDRLRSVRAQARGCGHVGQLPESGLAEARPLASESVDGTPSARLRGAELLDKVRTLLSEREWSVWYGVEVQHLDGESLARRLGPDWTVNAVHSTLRRSRQKLLRFLDADAL